MRTTIDIETPVPRCLGRSREPVPPHGAADWDASTALDKT
jgi:hypothetical protein